MPELDLSLLLYGLLVGLLAGGLGGVMAGLAGVGGGLIYMPVFYALMPGDSSVAVHVFASLVAVIITGFFSARSHWRLGHVDKTLLKQLLPGLIAGAMLGLWCTLRLPEVWVLLALASIYAWVAIDYGRASVRQRALNNTALPLFSGPVGFASGSLGIAGGTMLVPLLRRFVALRMAVGTSSACGLMMVLAAVSGNLLFEPGWHTVLETHSMFLLGAWLGVLLVLPVISERVARLHESIPEPLLRVFLKLIFTVLAVALLVAALLA